MEKQCMIEMIGLEMWRKKAVAHNIKLNTVSADIEKSSIPRSLKKPLIRPCRETQYFTARHGKIKLPTEICSGFLNDGIFRAGHVRSVCEVNRAVRRSATETHRS